jgi:hypothetical protein
MSEGEKYFSLSMSEGPGDIVIRDTDGKNVCAYDDNQVETLFSQSDEGGWGAGGGGNVTTKDLKAMADCIRDVIYGYSTSRKYSCQKDVFKMEISYDADTDRYTFTGALIEMLCWEYHISITKTNLTRAGLDEYIEPFFIWEKEHPVVKKRIRRKKYGD